jgi:hypothetical protein
MHTITVRRTSAVVLTVLTLVLGLLAIQAPTASAALFPAIGTYNTSPAGVILPTASNAITESILADSVTITRSGLPRFVVFVRVVNDSSSVQSTGCALSNGYVKKASDTWLTINGKTTLKATDSTCSQQPGFKTVLARGQASFYFAAFPLPPGLGTRVRLSSLFGSGTRYYTAGFNPYGGGSTDLQVIKVTKPRLLTLGDWATDGWDVARLTNAVENVALDDLTILDVKLLAPWDACTTSACLEHTLHGTPWLPSLQTTSG